MFGLINSVATNELVDRLRGIYRDLHTHPELSFQEQHTAGIAAGWLADLGFEVMESIATTGIAGVLRNGEGPTVLLRADMDALPVQEATGLAYASGVDGVMHACGHDMHVTCLLGAASELVTSREDWSGTVVAVFQPAEETAAGAAAMVADRLFDRVPRPAVVLGQHVAPIPAGTIGLRAGPTFAAADSLRVTLYGAGGHGSRPEATVDPVVMAAATVMRLQGIVAREVSGADMAVVTVGALRAGTKSNIIPDDAELLLNVRTYDAAVRSRVLSAIERIVRAEAQASGAAREPLVEHMESVPAVINDAAAAGRARHALAGVVGADRVIDPGPVTGSEDVGLLATAAGAPIVFWLLGGADPAVFAGASGLQDIARIVTGLPSNHSPLYAPVEDPTIRIGVSALSAAAREWLAGVPASPRQLAGVQDEEQEARVGREHAEALGVHLASGRNGLWLADHGDPKAGRGEGVGHRVHRPVPEAHQGGLPAHGPFLGPAVGRQIAGLAPGQEIDRLDCKGMVDGHDQPAALCQHAPQLGERRPPVLQVVQHQGRDDIVERTVGERQRAIQVGHLQVGAVTEPPPGQLQHSGAFVDAGHDRTPVA